MRCRSAQKMTSRRIDGALAPIDAVALESHLSRCAACQLAARRTEQAWHALADLEEAVRAPDDWARIEAATEARLGRWMPLWLRWQLDSIPAALAVLLALTVGTAGGVLLSNAALAPRPADLRAVPIEARVIAETLGDLPWGSPAARLAVVFDGVSRLQGRIP